MQCGCVEKVCSWTWWNLWGQAKAIIKGPGPPSGGAWWWWAFNVWCTTSSSCIVLVVWCSTTVWCSTNGGDAEVAGSCCVSCHQVFRLWPGWESINWMWHNLKLTESMSLVKRHASDWVLKVFKWQLTRRLFVWLVFVSWAQLWFNQVWDREWPDRSEARDPSGLCSACLLSTFGAAIGGAIWVWRATSSEPIVESWLKTGCDFWSDFPYAMSVPSKYKRNRKIDLLTNQYIYILYIKYLNIYYINQCQMTTTEDQNDPHEGQPAGAFLLPFEPEQMVGARIGCLG